MPDTRTFTGGCHCGLVRYECTTDLAVVTACASAAVTGVASPCLQGAISSS
jgi:hypothetical protein